MVIRSQPLQARMGWELISNVMKYLFYRHPFALSKCPPHKLLHSSLMRCFLLVIRSHTARPDHRIFCRRFESSLIYLYSSDVQIGGDFDGVQEGQHNERLWWHESFVVFVVWITRRVHISVCKKCQTRDCDSRSQSSQYNPDFTTFFNGCVK